MAPTPIYTVGYGNRSMDEFLALLARYGINYLIDVRSRPYSGYKPEFSRDSLETSVKEAGIRYVYMGDVLGGQPAAAGYYNEKGEVIYERYSEDPHYRRGIARLRRAWEQELPVAVMCSEANPLQCHRSKLLGQTLAGEGIDVRHIDEQGELKTQEEVVLEIHHGQTSMFGPAFTSRKKYRPGGGRARGGGVD